MILLEAWLEMSFAAGAFSSGVRSGGGGGGGGDGPRRLFSRIKEGKDGKEGSSGPSPITAQLMFQAMASMSPGGASTGSANKEHAKDQDHQLQDHDRKFYETDNG